ncbi:tetratricopeptide repeat protein, partial [Fibrobacterota bacterium]
MKLGCRKNGIIIANPPLKSTMARPETASAASGLAVTVDEAISLSSIPPLLHYSIVAIFLCLCLFSVVRPEESAADLLFNDAVDRYFEPIIVSEIIDDRTPRKIMENYREEKFRSAVVDLRRLIKLHLPDGRADLYRFMLAECYYQLDLHELAAKDYRRVLKYYPNTKFRAEVLFRLVQAYYALENLDFAIKAYKKLSKIYPGHQLTSGGAFICAKALIQKRNYAKATQVLGRVKSDSPFHRSARFLLALCWVWQDEVDEGIETLEKLASDPGDQWFKNECLLTIGLLYHQRDEHQNALKFYSKIPAASQQFPLASLKKAMVHLSKQDYQKAIASAGPVLENQDYFFEASLVLLDAYWGLRDSANASIV